MTTTTYISAWYSPRGFANEGVYLYGTRDEYRALAEMISESQTQTVSKISGHKTLDAAKARAEKEHRTSQKRKAWGEEDATDATSFAEFHAYQKSQNVYWGM